MPFFRKKHLRLFLFAFFLSIVLSQYSLLSKESSASLYGLIVCDTLSKDIKAVTTADMKRMTTTLSEISAITGLKETISIIEGTANSPNAIHRCILLFRLPRI
jgi:hypothetical protein